MKLIIDIDDNEYAGIKSFPDSNTSYPWTLHLYSAVRNGTPLTECKDAISRQAAIDALWKTLYDYEGKTEKRFQESEDLDVADWVCHRIFVQNMNDIDRNTIANLPSAQPKPELKPISYTECANAMLKMWMINVVTDGEYYRIMEKLNVWRAKEGEQNESNTDKETGGNAS